MDTRRQLQVIWGYRWWLALLCVVSATATYLGTSHLPRQYQADALVQLVSGREFAGQSLTSDQSLQLSNTYSDLARTRDVATKAKEQGHLSASIDTLQKNVKVSPQADLSVLDFQAQASSPDVAAAYANAFATAFSGYVGSRSDAQHQQVLDQINQRVTDIEKQLDVLKSQTDPTATALRSELQALQAQAALQRVQVGDQATIIQNAEVPTAAASPKPLLDAALALLAALVVGAGLCMLHHLRTDRYGSADEAKADLRLALLGEIPIAGRRTDARQVAEAFRSLRTNIEFASGGINHSVLVISSAGPRSGKSFVTEHLTRAFAVNGRKAMAVDADLHRPTLHTRLNLSPGPGLGDVLDRRHPTLIQEISTDVDLPVHARRRGGRMLALTVGAPVIDPSEALCTPTMAAAVINMRGENDVVLIDSPPLLACVDPVVLARYASGVVLVVDASGGRRRDIRRALQSLRAVDTPVLGFVYNRSEGRRTSYYGYYSSEHVPVNPEEEKAPGDARGADHVSSVTGTRDSVAASGVHQNGLIAHEEIVTRELRG